MTIHSHIADTDLCRGEDEKPNEPTQQVSRGTWTDSIAAPPVTDHSGSASCNCYLQLALNWQHFSLHANEQCDFAGHCVLTSFVTPAAELWK